MGNDCVSLSSVPVGGTAMVTGIAGEAANRRRFLDLGLIQGTVVRVLFKSPAQNPAAYQIRGAVIAIRGEDAKDIFVSRLT